MEKQNLRNLIANAGLVFSLLGTEACYRDIKNCNTLDAGKKRVETCISYEEGEATAKYTIYNGWGLPSSTVYDKGLNGTDGNIQYFYNRHHKLRKELIRRENGLEERFYDKDGKVIVVFVDESGTLEKLLKK